MAKVYEKLNDPKSVKIGELNCHVSKIPAFYAQRIIMAGGEALSSLDISKLPEAVLLELLSYSAVDNINGVPIVLDDIAIINEMIKNPKDLIALEMNLVEYNFGFFFDGSLQEVFAPIAELITKASETSTR